MKKRKLGKTNLQVSELGFGCWAIGGTSYGPTDDQESLRALSYARDHGINFFDTADTYGHGHSETLIGECFQESSKRTQIILASKVGWDFYHGGSKKNFDPDYIRFACAQSLKRLRTDYIDLYQLHNPKLELIEEGSIFKILQELKKEGKIRFWGVSIHQSEEGNASVLKGASTLQAVYNLIDQRMRKDLFQFCDKHDTGLIIREPLYCGLLTDKYKADARFSKEDHRNRWTKDQLSGNLAKIERIKAVLSGMPLKQAAIEFVLRQKSVSVVIPGIKTVNQLKDHLTAARSEALSSFQIDQIQELGN